MSKMLKTASDFQYSVNILYDLHNSEKIKNFIPTRSSLKLIEEVLQSTDKKSNRRARILIGAYGKGKSHIVLTILSLLMKHKREDFIHLNKKIEKNPELNQLIQNYYDKKGKGLLPVLISGSNTSLTQAFIIALQQTLSTHNLLELMPETNYKAAVQAIKKWQNEYPETFEKFVSILNEDINQFLEKLENFDIESYKTFEQVYPTLTAGSNFNPFLGFDVVELYESVVKELRRKNLYDGIYVVYDEFSKYLEANITTASVSDTKMLQDFAEKSCRSGENQLHLMLISHKEIANYIDKLPKQKLDGWRGISERFEHILLNNNFTQVYEIIGSVIQKEKSLWKSFVAENKVHFENLNSTYKTHELFKDLKEEELQRTFEKCYPLHPVSMFILPRLSERIAQNERTLFTFLSADGFATLPTYLHSYNDEKFSLITPDLIYDYFEPLLKKEVYSGSTHQTYVLTRIILEKIGNDNSLESKIIKTISLIYILEQFEKLKPLQDEIVKIYSAEYSTQEIESAIKNLIEKEFVLYLRQSNEYLKLKESSGIDIQKTIQDEINKQKSNLVIKDVLNKNNFDLYLYPYRYNDEKEMTRYFEFSFIDEDEVSENTNWKIKSEKIQADGIIYGIILKNEDSILKIKSLLEKTSEQNTNIIFVLLKKFTQIENIVRQCSALNVLIEKSYNDSILQDEYKTVYEDILEILTNFIRSYIRPENNKAFYIHNGKVLNLKRKSHLSETMSIICDELYSESPIINNEAINKNEITSVTLKNRNKIVASLLRNELEQDLALTGFGPDVAIMRNTLICTGLLENSENPKINFPLDKKDDKSNLNPLLNEINIFVQNAKETGKISFNDLYENLTTSKNKIGARKGIIPIFVACVFHQYKKQISLLKNGIPVLLNAENLSLINEKPEDFELCYLEWDSEKDNYIEELERIFALEIFENEKEQHSYDYIQTSLRRWYMKLPKFTKETKIHFKTEKCEITKERLSFLKQIKQSNGAQDLLFVKFPKVFGVENCDVLLAKEIQKVKLFFENLIFDLQEYISTEVKNIFSATKENKSEKSLSSVIKDWTEKLNQCVFEQLFQNNTERFLSICKDFSNDEAMFIQKISQVATGLRIEDWNENTIEQFLERIKEFKQTAENFIREQKEKSEEKLSTSYELKFVQDDGSQVTKRFDKVPQSIRGKLLYNKITSELDAMGLSITEAEKRQVLMNILKELC